MFSLLEISISLLTCDQTHGSEWHNILTEQGVQIESSNEGHVKPMCSRAYARLFIKIDAVQFKKLIQV
jgi:hypothetical protein